LSISTLSEDQIKADTQRLLPEPVDPAILQAIEVSCELGKKAELVNLEREFGYKADTY
jgi:hypothetical protein